MPNRKPAGLDFGTFDDIKAPEIRTPPTSEKVEAVAVKEGFTSRQAKQTKGKGAKIDGRTLRNSPRKTQLNMNVQAETKDRFWLLAQSLNISLGDELLTTLMDSFEKNNKS